MNFLSYKYFVAVANANSIKEAANALMIAPQSLSEHIRNLEQELGVELLTHTRPARLTVCGERFLRYAEAMIHERYQLEKELRELTDKRRELVISISGSNFPPFLTDVIAAFSDRYPDCLVNIVERPTEVSASLLHSYDLNISSESLCSNMTEIVLQSHVFHSKPQDDLNANHLAVVVRKSLLKKVWKDQLESRISEFERKPELKVFKDLPFIRLMDPGMDTMIDALFQAHRFFPTVVIKSKNSELCCSLCLAGAGAMVIPDGWAMRKLGAHMHDENLLLFRMHEIHPHMDTIVSYPKGKKLTEEENALIEMMKELIAHL